MSEPGADLPWTCEQWATIQRTALEAARKARVASSFLPLVGPLPEGVASVPALALETELPDPRAPWYGTAPVRHQIDDGRTKKLTTLACEVFVTTQQASDPDLASVLQMVSRAAVVIARLEDAIVLVGQPGPGSPPTWSFAEGSRDLIVEPEIYRVQGGERNPGLQRVSSFYDRDTVPEPLIVDGEERGDAEHPNLLVERVTEAIQQLEGYGQYGPFGAVLGHGLFAIAHRPTVGTLVLPADQFVPFLAGGPLLRSSALPADEGVIVATAGSPVDLVVGTDIHVSYVQRSVEPRYVLRISERLVLRIKEPQAVAHLKLSGAAPPLASQAADPVFER